MKSYSTLLVMLVLSVFTAGSIMAQTVTGTVVDPDSNEPVIGASVLIVGTTYGTVTDVDGNFSIDVSSATNPVLRVSYVGFDTKLITVASDSDTDLGNVELVGQSLGLEEVVVMGVVDIADDRRTPVAVSTITAREISIKSGNTEFPDVMKNTPSIYVSNQNGGFGDSQIFTRGFDQTNTAFLLNGQPINGMEDGKMYWSNWSGMNDIANAVQVQRGLGSSKLAISSVGGTVNIITKATEKQKGGWAGFTYGNDNYLKGTVAYNTGLMENGWGVSALLTHWQGDGWAEGTKGQGQNYFLSVGYQPNDKHNFNFLITGAPQWHDQNFTDRISDNLEAEENGVVDDFRKFNNNFGELDGEYLTERRNYYHKPVTNLNWAWNMNEKSSLSTVLYASWGRGGGTGSVGSRPRTADGLVDFDRIQFVNDSIGGASNYALRASVNSHQWYGVVTNFEHKLNDNVTLSIGGDLRRYTGLHFRQITDLLGADFFSVSGHEQLGDYQIRDENTYEPDPWKALSNYAEEGERWNYDYSETIQYGGLFGQAEYAKDAFSAFVQGSVSSQSHVRVDRFQYSEANEESESITNPGYNIKGGANYNINDNHSLFVNAGLYSRQPYHDNLYLAFQNIVNKAAENEDILGLELGYRFRSDVFDLNVNAYRTNWQNRTETSAVFPGDTVSIDGQMIAFPEDGEDGFLNTTNINQLHQGVEVDFKYRATSDLSIRGYASFGNWVYDGTTASELYDNERNLLASEDGLDITDIKVGGSAQTSMGIGISYNITRSLDVYADYNYYDNLYGSSSYTSPDDAIELPSYGLLDLGVGYRFLLDNGDVLRLRANVYNLLNEEYISYTSSFGGNIAPDADDANNWNGVNVANNVQFGQGTTFNVSLRYSF